MNITGENTVISCAWGHLVVSKHITGENTVISYPWVNGVVFYAY